MVNFALLSDDEDRLRAARSLKDMATLAMSPEFNALGAHFFAVKFSARLRRLNQPTFFNRTLSAASALLYNTIPFSRLILESMMPAGPSASQLLASTDAELSDFAMEYVGSSGHHIGTCRMGAPKDQLAVVDANGNLLGVKKLRVIDASIMPRLPRGNTNLPTLMLAEKLAAAVLGERKA